MPIPTKASGFTTQQPDKNVERLRRELEREILKLKAAQAKLEERVAALE